MEESSFVFPDKLENTIVCGIPQKGEAPPTVDPGFKDVPAFDEFDNNVYLFHVDVNAPRTHVAVSTSTKQIKVYDIETKGLVADVAQFTDAISSLKFYDESVLYASSEAGEVLFWDIRSNQQVSTLKYNHELYSCAAKDNIIAGGSRSEIPLWDLRTLKPIQCLDYHSKDVTQLSFHPVTNHLYSSGYDGLSVIFDLQQTNEDDMVVNVINAGQGIQRFSFAGHQSEYVCYILDSEDLLIRESTDDSTPVFYSGFGFRDKLSEIAQTPVNYLIRCHYFDHLNKIVIVGGSFDGNVIIFSLESDGFKHITTLTGGHQSVVRDFHFGKGLITVGEDSKLCMWGETESKKVILKGFRSTNKADVRYKPY